MAMGTGESETATAASSSIDRITSGDSPRPRRSIGGEGENGIASGDAVDLEFEWYQLCHGCGNRTWFNGLICDDCRWRHGI